MNPHNPFPNTARKLRAMAVNTEETAVVQRNLGLRVAAADRYLQALKYQLEALRLAADEPNGNPQYELRRAQRLARDAGIKFNPATHIAQPQE